MFDPNDAPVGYVAIPVKSTSNGCFGCALLGQVGARDTPEDRRMWNTCFSTTTHCDRLTRADRCDAIFVKRDSPFATSDFPEEMN